MAVGAQKVLVIYDARKGICTSAARSSLDGLSLTSGDELTLLGLLRLDTLRYYTKCGDFHQQANDGIIREIEITEEEYQKKFELLQLHKLFEVNKINLNIFLVPTRSTKVFGVQAAKRMNATWVILDRKVKKDRQYFLENLSCGISRLKRGGSVEQFRGPKPERKRSCISYDEMIPH
ncbi:hypothetical protein H6P81_007882 [Aristolochia fimbriata]|uniref:Uncharacterized protein n=1 Tax=Aristolochia fimbriata TaxID=158543 RepID=A0AAV7F1S7_ARIFI|nr:hypothetical protein H6P81_007882 [Aristolochia fimbriata]